MSFSIFLTALISSDAGARRRRVFVPAAAPRWTVVGRRTSRTFPVATRPVTIATAATTVSRPGSGPENTVTPARTMFASLASGQTWHLSDPATSSAATLSWQQDWLLPRQFLTGKLDQWHCANLAVALMEINPQVSLWLWLVNIKTSRYISSNLNPKFASWWRIQKSKPMEADWSERGKPGWFLHCCWSS